MRTSTLLVIIIFLTLGCNNWKHSTNFSYHELNYIEFEKQLKLDSNYLLIDVRTPREYLKGHIKNAINMSYFHSWFTDSIQKLDKSKTIYMYCQTQHRSPLASKKMKKMGFKKIVDLQGGFVKWEKNQLAIQK
ncbi:MAG: rhodanese-like domain-containing protein [Bacteroidia bacterium]|nr:rhodanese-like domain-containing protein [Bacteroidia bacterium]